MCIFVVCVVEVDAVETVDGTTDGAEVNTVGLELGVEEISVVGSVEDVDDGIDVLEPNVVIDVGTIVVRKDGDTEARGATDAVY